MILSLLGVKSARHSVGALDTVNKRPRFEASAAFAPLNFNKEHAHVRDSHIVFEPDEHVYTVRGERVKLSVTSLLDNFVPGFDMEKYIRDMFKGLTSEEKTTKGKHKGHTYAEVKQRMDNTRDRGSRIHDYIEKYYEGLKGTPSFHLPLEERKEILFRPHVDEYGDVPPSVGVNRALEQFLKFDAEWSREGWLPYRSEWRIYSSEIPVAGSVDMVFYRDTPEGVREFALVDWKVSENDFKSINFHYTNPKTCFYPLVDLEATTYTRYALQLGVYARILRHDYKIKMNRMLLVKFDPSKESFPVSSMKNAIDEDMEPYTRMIFGVYKRHCDLEAEMKRWRTGKSASYSEIHPVIPKMLEYMPGEAERLAALVSDGQ